MEKEGAVVRVEAADAGNRANNLDRKYNGDEADNSASEAIRKARELVSQANGGKTQFRSR